MFSSFFLPQSNIVKHTYIIQNPESRIEKNDDDGSDGLMFYDNDDDMLP